MGPPCWCARTTPWICFVMSGAPGCITQRPRPSQAILHTSRVSASIRHPCHDPSSSRRSPRGLRCWYRRRARSLSNEAALLGTAARYTQDIGYATGSWSSSAISQEAPRQERSATPFRMASSQAWQGSLRRPHARRVLQARHWPPTHVWPESPPLEAPPSPLAYSAAGSPPRQCRQRHSSRQRGACHSICSWGHVWRGTFQPSNGVTRTRRDRVRKHTKRSTLRSTLREILLAFEEMSSSITASLFYWINYAHEVELIRRTARRMSQATVSLKNQKTWKEKRRRNRRRRERDRDRDRDRDRVSE